MIEVKAINQTTYGDDSVWLTYYQDETYYGYELRYPKNILEPIREDKIPVDQLKSRSLIYDALYSENDMLYIDEYEDKEYYDECKQLLEEDCELHPELAEHITYEPYDDDTSTIVVSGDIIVNVLFLLNR